MCLCGAGGDAPFNPLWLLRPPRALPCQAWSRHPPLPSPAAQPISSARPSHIKRSRSRGVCDWESQQMPPRVSTRRSRDVHGWTLLPASGQSTSLLAPRGAPVSVPTPHPAALRMGAETGVSKSGKPPASPGPTAARPPASCRCQPLAKPRDAVPRVPAQAPPLT